MQASRNGIKKLLLAHPNHVAIIIHQEKSEKIKKYLVNADNTVADLINLLRVKNSIQAKESIFIYIIHKNEYFLASTSSSLREIYEKYKDMDLVLHVVYARENIFG